MKKLKKILISTPALFLYICVVVFAAQQTILSTDTLNEAWTKEAANNADLLPKIQSTDPTSSDDSGIYVNTTDGDAFIVSKNVGVSTWTTTYTAASVAPTLSTWTIQTDGISSILEFSAPVTFGVGGSGGFATDTPTHSYTYVSGDTTDTITFSHDTIYSTDSPTGDYTQPTDGWEAVTGGVDLVSFSGATVVNNSTQTQSTYVGYPNTNGTPDSSPVSEFAVIDNLISTQWTAPANGTFSTINAYVSTWVANDYEGVCLYRDITGTITLVGKATYTASTSGWTGDITLVAESGQTLDFSTGDVLYFGGVASSNNVYGYGRNDTGGTGMYVNTSHDLSSGPPATTTFTTSSERQMGFIGGVIYD